MPTLVLKNIKKSFEVKELLHACIEEMKKERRMRIGEIVGDDTLGSTACPYCDNPVVLMGQFSGDLKPDYVIPFKVDKKAAKKEEAAGSKTADKVEQAVAKKEEKAVEKADKTAEKEEKAAENILKLEEQKKITLKTLTLKFHLVNLLL